MNQNDKIILFFENKVLKHIGFSLIFMIINLIFSLLVFKDLSLFICGFIVSLIFLYKGLRLKYIQHYKKYTDIRCWLLEINRERGVIVDRTKTYEYTFSTENDELIYLRYKNKVYGIEPNRCYTLIYENANNNKFEPYNLIGIVEV